MRKNVVCLFAAVAAAGAFAQDEDIRAYCGDLAKARGEPAEGNWSLQCRRTLQVQRDYARRAESRRQVDATVERNEWIIQGLRNKRLAKEAPTEAERQVAAKNLEDLLAACPGYFPVTRCVNFREEWSK